MSELQMCALVSTLVSTAVLVLHYLAAFFLRYMLRYMSGGNVTSRQRMRLHVKFEDGSEIKPEGMDLIREGKGWYIPLDGKTIKSVGLEFEPAPVLDDINE